MEPQNLNKSSAVAEIGDRGHNRHGSKRGGCCATFAVELGPRLTQSRLGRGLPPYEVASSSIQPFGNNRRAKNWMKGCAFFSGGSWVPIEHKVAWAEVYLRTKCHLNPSSRLATADIGRRLGRLCPFRGGEAGSPSNTMPPRLRPTSVPSGILMHKAV